MTSSSRLADWCRFYEAAAPDYKPHALHAVLKNDGAKMLNAVVKQLGLTVERLIGDMNA